MTTIRENTKRWPSLNGDSPARFPLDCDGGVQVNANHPATDFGQSALRDADPLRKAFLRQIMVFEVCGELFHT